MLVLDAEKLDKLITYVFSKRQNIRFTK